ncbi:MAG: RidA family protein [Gaiellaceae bacterium MAG52_C11]|nr:RidA family protein [Candidatus Gaiellasilicea maunaloa]
MSADSEGQTVGVGDIQTQTRNVFRSIEHVLAEAGASMRDVVKLNTSYVNDAVGHELREYWEKMTRVRMEFFDDPGPCGTGVRVVGHAHPDLLIEVEAIAYLPSTAATPPPAA